MDRLTRKHNVHPFEPVYDACSQILIVGTFPSVISRQQNFYYGNPRNRFYAVLAALLGETLPVGTDEKREFLLRNHIAVFDVLRSCEIHGSADSTICSEEPNDFGPIFEAADIACVFTNGRTAHRLYERFFGPAVYLPSTSPANASFDLARLEAAWSVILPYLQTVPRGSGPS